MESDCEQDGQHVLCTERLILRLASPWRTDDCEQVLQVLQEQKAAQGGNERLEITTVEDVQYKYYRMGPRAEFCTLAPPPKGHIFMIFRRQTNEAANDVDNDCVGMIAISFRREMPYPDLGWAVVGPYQGQGYATEAGRGVVRFWRDVVGVREICAMTLDYNEKSQRLAERIGFIEGGPVDVIFGKPESEEKMVGRGFVLPGMEWKKGLWIRPTIQRPEGWKWDNSAD